MIISSLSSHPLATSTFGLTVTSHFHFKFFLLQKEVSHVSTVGWSQPWEHVILGHLSTHTNLPHVKLDGLILHVKDLAS